MLFGNARPILPGKLDRVRGLDQELAAHRATYDALNASYGIRRHVMWVSHLVDGTDLWVNIYDMDPDDMARMRGRTWDPDGSDYDRWWLAWVEDVFGVDMRAHNGLAGPPEQLFEWQAPTSLEAGEGDGIASSSRSEGLPADGMLSTDAR